MSQQLTAAAIIGPVFHWLVGRPQLRSKRGDAYMVYSLCLWKGGPAIQTIKARTHNKKRRTEPSTMPGDISCYPTRPKREFTAKKLLTLFLLIVTYLNCRFLLSVRFFATGAAGWAAETGIRGSDERAGGSVAKVTRGADVDDGCSSDVIASLKRNEKVVSFQSCVVSGFKHQIVSLKGGSNDYTLCSVRASDSALRWVLLAMRNLLCLWSVHNTAISCLRQNAFCWKVNSSFQLTTKSYSV